MGTSGILNTSWAADDEQHNTTKRLGSDMLNGDMEFALGRAPSATGREVSFQDSVSRSVAIRNPSNCKRLSAQPPPPIVGERPRTQLSAIQAKINQKMAAIRGRRSPLHCIWRPGEVLICGLSVRHRPATRKFGCLVRGHECA